MVDEEREPRRPSAASREILDDLMDWSGKVFKKVREEADSLSTRGKLKIDITTLKSKRGSEFKKLGQKVHRLLEDGNLDVAEIESNVARIDGLADEIRDKESQFKDLGRKAGAKDAAETDEVAEEVQEIEEESRD
jgi:uncharacterized protein YoxC